MTDRVGPVDRRQALKLSAGAALGAGLGLGRAAAAGRPALKIGYVTPSTGPLAGFAAADNYILDGFRAATANGIAVGGGSATVEVLVRDSQSNPNRAAAVAKDLIVGDGVNLMMVQATPETCVPVATQCEIEGVPCISSVVPWQPYFFGRQADPAKPKPFKYTYHFFWGIEDVITAYTAMWAQVATDRKVGGLFPNDADGNAWGDPTIGFLKPLAAKGYALPDPGRYQDLTDDFSAQIAAYKGAGAEILTGVVLPPDFTTFWNQARQQGYRPKVASIAKAILFPEAVAALGSSGHNLSTEVWWGPTHPFKSSLTGTTARALADGYTAATGKPWTQPIGFTHALLEAAVDTFKRSADPVDPDANAASMAALDLATVVGRIKFGSDGLPPFARANICRTPLVGGQWRLKDGRYDLVIVENGTAPEIPLGGRMEAIT